MNCTLVCHRVKEKKNGLFIQFLSDYCLLNSSTHEICIRTIILDIHSLHDEKAKTVKDAVNKSINKFPIQEKIVGYASVTFGALNSDTEGNVHVMLEKELGRIIIPIGCASHIFHNALGSGVHSVILIHVENEIIKIFNHFKYQTV